ncbi:hypothetical protein [Erythrobacter sp. BLCC-B19]|uniref:hypothetical protein n=1 Tax=Erythrobacter sp. BLCC-B19 TaxID=3025315 RepID=UPI00235E1280|nr:hypothetical protein [Erythrobacter sp. BLCC-B19]WDA42221.1 hypothetical protein PS060_05245 [Erythrobacter sp. BLCC-B19]
MLCNRNSGVLLAAALSLMLAGCAKDSLGSGGAPMTGSVPGRAAAPPPPPPPPPPPSPAPAVYRVASGSPSVLARLPRGTLVTRETAICLKAGEQITVSGSNGQSVTYSGPGCLKRSAPATPQNLGGFTFGWRAPISGETERGAAK